MKTAQLLRFSNFFLKDFISFCCTKSQSIITTYKQREKGGGKFHWEKKPTCDLRIVLLFNRGYLVKSSKNAQKSKMVKLQFKVLYTFFE
jgi:hypothetical protein